MRLHRHSETSPLVEKPELLFCFQSQETQDRGGQTPSTERQLLSVRHIYKRNLAALTSPRKVCLQAERTDFQFTLQKQCLRKHEGVKVMATRQPLLRPDPSHVEQNRKMLLTFS